MKAWHLAITVAFFSSAVSADMADDLDGLVGYTIVASKTIESWYDEDGKKDDSFEGCDYDRTIVFTDGRILHCAEYGYQYAYRPTAVILVNGNSYKMVVEDTFYDMRR